jgi:mono/diheme cytochrome c family protein
MSGRIAALALAAGVLAGQQTGAQIPKQAQRGMDLFSEKRCSTCHKLGDSGTAIGPDLPGIARVTPKGITVMILSTRTEFVKTIELKNVHQIPAMRVQDDGKMVRFYDLSKDPPALVEVEKSRVASVRNDEKWRHPPSSANLSEEQLADIIAYIRWASYGDRKGVDPEEVR